MTGNIKIGQGDNAPAPSWIMPFDPTGSDFTLEISSRGSVILTQQYVAGDMTKRELVIDVEAKKVTWPVSTSQSQVLPLGRNSSYKLRRIVPGGETRIYYGGLVDVVDGPVACATVGPFYAGPQGVPGPEGEQGPIGTTGPQGATGDTGPQGAVGPKGDIGDRGIQGAVGDKGDQGIQGVKGDAGDQGIQGVKGDAGPQGPQGNPTTINGKTGATITLAASDVGALPATAPTWTGLGTGGTLSLGGGAVGSFVFAATGNINISGNITGQNFLTGSDTITRGIFWGASNDTSITRLAIGTLKYGGDASVPQAYKFTLPNVTAGTLNGAGGQTVYVASLTTGSATSLGWAWQLSGIGASGTAQNAPFTAMTLTSLFNGVPNLTFPGGNGNIVGVQEIFFGTTGAGGQWFANLLALPSATPFAWSATTNAGGTKDAGLSRVSAGDVGVGNGAAGSVSGRLIAANVVISPPASAAALAANGQMTFQLTSDTTLTIKVRGSDGITRSCPLTLA